MIYSEHDFETRLLFFPDVIQDIAGTNFQDLERKAQRYEHPTKWDHMQCVS